jgi:hypothetical protein
MGISRGVKLAPFVSLAVSLSLISLAVRIGDPLMSSPACKSVRVYSPLPISYMRFECIPNVQSKSAISITYSGSA